MSVCDERDTFAEIWLKSIKKLEELHKLGQIERSSHWALSLLSLPPPPLHKAYCIKTTAHIFVDPEELMKTQLGLSDECLLDKLQNTEEQRVYGWFWILPTGTYHREATPKTQVASVIFYKSQ